MRKAGVVCAVAAAAGDVAKSCCESLVARKEEREGSSCETAAARPAQKKQLQSNISCSHILDLAAKCCHSLDAMASTAPSPVDIIVEHHGHECL